MAVTVVNISSVTKALISMLTEDSKLSESNIAAMRAEVINEDPGMCPWVGVYRSGVRYSPRTVGAGPGAMKQTIDLILVVQQSDGTSGEQCEERLESLIADVTSVILTDTTVKGLVHALMGVNISYDDYRVAGGQFMQTAVMRMTYETRVI